MKTFGQIFAFLLAGLCIYILFATSCENYRERQIRREGEAMFINQEPRETEKDGLVFKTVEVNGCEYVVVSTPRSPTFSIIHKGNCKNPHTIIKEEKSK